jgi:hypothetical protein
MVAIRHRWARVAVGLVSFGLSVVGGGIASAGPTLIEGIKRPSAIDKSTATPTPPPPAFELSAPTVSPYDPTTCKIRWETTVKNIGSESTVPLGVQAYGTKLGTEVGPAGGTSIEWMAKGQARTQGMTVDPYHYKTGGLPAPTHLLSALSSGATRLATSAQTPLPVIPPFATTVTVQPGRVTDTWSITLKNQGSSGYPMIGIVVQAYASNSTSGPWDASGGPPTPDCLASQKDVLVTGRRLADHRYLKVEIYRQIFTLDKKVESRTVLWERVLDSAPLTKSGVVVAPSLIKQ